MSDTEHTSTPIPPSTEKSRSRRRWPGIFTSLLVPGFGLARAGHFGRAVAWFVGIHAGALVVVGAFIWRQLPSSIVALVFCAQLAFMIAMLVDSFRPGRLTGKMWVSLILLFGALVLLPTVPSMLAHSFVTPTGSMFPTLRGPGEGNPADHFFADKVCYRFSLPVRGELVAFSTAGIERLVDRPAQIYIKRIVGLPGERIAIRDGKIFANGRELGANDGIPAVKYTQAQSRDFMNADDEFEVPQDAYFMLGDNSPKSFDSRYWGFVPKQSIFGRVARIYYPFTRIGVPR